MLDEAPVEHDAAKKLIAKIEAMKPADGLYDAKEGAGRVRQASRKRIKSSRALSLPRRSAAIRIVKKWASA
jgi:hypothetical protein